MSDVVICYYHMVDIYEEIDQGYTPCAILWMRYT